MSTRRRSRVNNAALMGLLALISLASCKAIDTMPPDLPCREAGYAIAARTAECTGDTELGQARYDRFREEFTCIEWSPEDPMLTDTGATVHAEDLFSCAFTIRNVPCELEPELGDDLGAWLALDPGCTWVVDSGTAADSGGTP